MQETDSQTDLLGYQPFAEKVAQALVNAKNEEGSYVLGINAPWGNGKTWTKNRIKSILQEKHKNCVVAEFHPWRYSSHNKIYEGFQDVLKTIVPNFKDQRLIELIIEQSAPMRFLRTILYEKSLAAALLSMVFIFLVFFHFIGAQSDLIGLLQGNPLGYFFWYILGCILVMIVVYIFLKSQIVCDFLNPISNNDAHEKLKNVFLKEYSKKTAIIFIDEIDRLKPKQALEVFEIIKANYDLPNIVYVLLYNKEIIEKFIEYQSYPDPVKYLQKIVSHEVELPQNIEEKILNIYKERRANTLSNYNVTLDHKLKDYEENYIVPSLSNIRGVNEFFDSLGFLLLVNASDGNQLEIDFLDALIVIFLKIYNPDFLKIILQKDSDDKIVYPLNKTDRIEEFVKNKSYNYKIQHSLNQIKQELMGGGYTYEPLKPFGFRSAAHRPKYLFGSISGQLTDVEYSKYFFNIKTSKDVMQLINKNLDIKDDLINTLEHKIITGQDTLTSVDLAFYAIMQGAPKFYSKEWFPEDNIAFYKFFTKDSFLAGNVFSEKDLNVANTSHFFHAIFNFLGRKDLFDEHEKQSYIPYLKSIFQKLSKTFSNQWREGRSCDEIYWLVCLHRMNIFWIELNREQTNYKKFWSFKIFKQYPELFLLWLKKQQLDDILDIHRTIGFLGKDALMDLLECYKDVINKAHPELQKSAAHLQKEIQPKIPTFTAGKDEHQPAS